MRLLILVSGALIALYVFGNPSHIADTALVVGVIAGASGHALFEKFDRWMDRWIERQEAEE